MNDNKLLINVFIISVIIFGIILVCCSVNIHFSSYDSKYVPVKATIINMSCERYVINRKRDDYHCAVLLRYTLNDNALESTIQLDSQHIHYIGSELLVYVNKDNPVEVYIPYVSNEFLSLGSCILGLMLLLITSGTLLLEV